VNVRNCQGERPACNRGFPNDLSGPARDRPGRSCRSSSLRGAREPHPRLRQIRVPVTPSPRCLGLQRTVGASDVPIPTNRGSVLPSPPAQLAPDLPAAPPRQKKPLTTQTSRNTAFDVAPPPSLTPSSSPRNWRSGQSTGDRAGSKPARQNPIDGQRTRPRSQQIIPRHRAHRPSPSVPERVPARGGGSERAARRAVSRHERSCRV